MSSARENASTGNIMNGMWELIGQNRVKSRQHDYSGVNEHLLPQGQLTVFDSFEKR